MHEATVQPPLRTAPLRIALAGLGTVGVGVLQLIEANRAIVEARAGRPIAVVAVSAREAGRERGVDISGHPFEADMTALAQRPDVDVVVEAVGGADGPALALAEAALAAGKGLVTANKAMIAQHGLRLAQLAEATGAPLAFEAAVAGGIPVVKGLREGVAANALERITGILNGTSNYILTTMEATGMDFAAALAEAQAKGYAEADPAFDVDGVDAAHKLAILAAIGFGARVDFRAVSVSGIREVRAADIAQARALGFVIRLVGVADCAGGRLLQRVRPCLVPTSHPLAHVTGPTNAVVAEGNFAGRLLFQGAGAGAGPTASAIVADLIDIARGTAGAPFSLPAGELQPMERADPGDRTGRDGHCEADQQQQSQAVHGVIRGSARSPVPDAHAAPGQCAGNLHAYRVIRIVEPALALGVGHRQPVRTDQHEHDIAAVELALDGVDEVLTGRDAFEVAENFHAREGLQQVLMQRLCVAAAVLASIRDEKACHALWPQCAMQGMKAMRHTPTVPASGQLPGAVPLTERYLMPMHEATLLMVCSTGPARHHGRPCRVGFRATSAV